MRHYDIAATKSDDFAGICCLITITIECELLSQYREPERIGKSPRIITIRDIDHKLLAARIVSYVRS